MCKYESTFLIFLLHVNVMVVPLVDFFKFNPHLVDERTHIAVSVLSNTC